MQSSLLSPGGQAVSSPGFDDSSWFNVSVPATVLAGLEAAGQYPPLFEGNNLQAVDASRFDQPWWFRTCAEPGARATDAVTLVLEGVNYRADAYCNGELVRSSSELVGTFVYHRLDLSPMARTGDRLCVALRVARPHDVFWTRNATDLAIDFVDWSPDPPDGNMGLWREAKLQTSPPLRLRHIAAATVLVPDALAPAGRAQRNAGEAFPIAGMPASHYRDEGGSGHGPGSWLPRLVPGRGPQPAGGALVTLTVRVANDASGPGPNASGSVRFRFGDDGVWCNAPRRVTLSPGAALDVTVGPSDCPPLNLSRTQAGKLLWWPWVLGPQTLVPVTAELWSELPQGDALRASPLAQVSASVGLRQVWSGLDSRGSRVFEVNGLSFPVRGGGFAPDLFQRTSSRDAMVQVLHARNAGLNTLRFEGKFQSEELFLAMDRLGVMALPGLCCCDAWQNWELWGPEQERVARRSVHDQLLRLRGHPAMLGFLASSDELPPLTVQQAYDVAARAAGWGEPIIAAAASADSPVWGPSGVKMAGPYAWVPPSYWRDPAMEASFGGASGFSTEISPGASPLTLDSWNATVAGNESLVWPEGSGASSMIWKAHCGNPHGLFGSLRFFLPSFRARYGAVPASMRGVAAARWFTSVAQAAALESHGAMFAAYRARQAQGATGVVQWMANNAYPQHIWHLWDRFNVAGGAYAGVQRATARVAVLWNDFAATAAVANDGPSAVPVGARVVLSLHDLSGRSLLRRSVGLSRGVPPRSVVELDASLVSRSEISDAAHQAGGVALLRLALAGLGGSSSPNVTAAATHWLGTSVDRVDASQCNFYRCNCSSLANLTALAASAPHIATQDLSVSSRWADDEPFPATVGLSLRRGVVVVANKASSGVALLVRLRVLRAAQPWLDALSFWEANFVTLLPGEQRTVAVTVDPAESGDTLRVAAESLNDAVRPE